jgi:hypothetical protein
VKVSYLPIIYPKQSKPQGVGGIHPEEIIRIFLFEYHISIAAHHEQCTQPDVPE